MPVAAVPRVGRSSGKLDERGVSLNHDQRCNFSGGDESQSWSKMSEFGVSHHPNQSELHLIVEATSFCNGGKSEGVSLGNLESLLITSSQMHTLDQLNWSMVSLVSDGFFFIPGRFMHCAQFGKEYFLLSVLKHCHRSTPISVSSHR